MERESFEDEEVAAFLNEHYVAVKVDREERPDVDHIYMTVCQAVTGQGGWPLTIVMMPDKEPFFAGTYFPKEAKWGRSGLIEILSSLIEHWRQNRDKVEKVGKIWVSSIKKGNKKNGRVENAISEDILHSAFQQLLSDFDPDYGGFGSAPKFPTPHNIMFLLRYFYRTGDNRALSMAVKTLDAMSRGGIYDHLGYGFARYSTDREWFAPHFEKMLYDNALLCYAYIEAYQCTGDQNLARVAQEIIEYVLRDMTGEDGEFYSAEDADSEGKEGKFYIWSWQEIRDVLGSEKGDLFADVYNVTKDGNFEDGENILHLINHDLRGYATKRNLNFASLNRDLNRDLREAREKLYQVRKKRVHPFKDDKVLTAWNGLMIAALAKAGRVLGREDYIVCARRAVSSIYDKLFRTDGRLLARYRDGESDYLGYVDDHAFLLWGLLELYESTFEPDYLAKALKIAADLRQFFWDEEEGGFFFSASDSEQLIVRNKEIHDGAIPSGNSVAVLQLLKLAGITDNDDYNFMAEKLFYCFYNEAAVLERAYTFFLIAVDFYLYSAPAPRQIIIAGDEEDEEVKAMLALIHKAFLPETVTFFNNPRYMGQNEKFLMHMTGQKAINGQATAYVCENFACQTPLTSAAELEKTFKFLNP